MVDGGEQGKATFEGLTASIAKEGIHHPIVLYQGTILDGRNRLEAGKEVGYKFKDADFTEFKGTPAEAKAFVMSTNIHRRHLTEEQKKDLARNKLKENPDLSNNKIAKMVGLTHPTVGKLRKEMDKPPEGEQKYENFCKEWDGLSFPNRARFVQEFLDEIVQHPPFSKVLETISTRVSA
jgi:hypothetical protein